MRWETGGVYLDRIRGIPFHPVIHLVLNLSGIDPNSIDHNVSMSLGPHKDEDF